MVNKTQLGWFTLKEDTTFRNTFDCAAWYELVRVPAGRYPVMATDFKVNKNKDDRRNNQISSHVDGAYVMMEGEIVSDYFAGQYFGVPISDYDTKQNAGKPASYHLFSYLHEIARDIIDGGTTWEMLPEFEARPIDFEYNGEKLRTYGIFKHC